METFTLDTWERHFLSDVLGDMYYLAIAVVLVSVYSYLVLGSFNPILFRSVTVFFGILCVFLSVVSGYALAFATGLKLSRFHNIIPFLLVGVGVDDMFVIVNSIDQVNESVTNPNERFVLGMKHAGPSITIAAVTGILAFLLGSLTALPALKSFCIFSAACMITLYFAFMTIFAPIYINDLKRLFAKKGDCCGLCCCKTDTVLCCRGYFLTKK